MPSSSGQKLLASCSKAVVHANRFLIVNGSSEQPVVLQAAKLLSQYFLGNTVDKTRQIEKSMGFSHRNSASRYSRTARVLSDGSLQSTSSLPGTPLPTGICLDVTGVDRKPFALDQTCVHAATQHVVEQPAKQRAVTEATVPIEIT